jgi:hypothetical protein
LDLGIEEFRDLGIFNYDVGAAIINERIILFIFFIVLYNPDKN